MNWQNYPKIDSAWQAEHVEYHPIVLQLLYNRGITKTEEIKEFLGDEGIWHDPFLFRNMQAACDLIIGHIKAGNKIVVYGDYDADGVTSSVVLVEVLNILKAQVEVWIPSRVTHGYGMNKEIIKELAEKNVKLIITVDNGIRSKEEVALAKELGMDVVVTDHHTAPSDEHDLPDCLIIDPIIEQETYPFKYLSGVGVAFKLASALTELAKIDERTKQNIKEKVLDVLAIGTVADCVKVYGENRIFIRQGLEMLNKHRRLGLVELIRSAGIKDSINEWNIGWQLAPRLNVAGRLDHANTAFELLITDNREEAQALAQRLHEKNIIRQEITSKIVEQCQIMVDRDQPDDKILVCIESDGDEPWPEGVIGLVAGRLSEHYSRPVLIISKLDVPGSKENKFKGSARSIEQFNVVAALEECSEHLEKFGGHKMAAGFTVKNLDQFIKQIKMLGEQKLAGIDLTPVLKIEADLEIGNINSELVNEILRFAPFGQENPIPNFASYGVVIKDIMTMGMDEQHIKFRFNGFWALAFGQAEKWQELKIGDQINIAYNLEWNEFNGNKSIQLRVLDIQKASD